METDRAIFIDTSFLVALFNPGDSLHAAALSLARRLDAGRASFLISNYIFLETVTVLAQRQAKKTALAAGAYLLSEPRLQSIHIDEQRQGHAWSIFQKAAGKNISFVDCSSVAIMKDEGIESIATFDKTDFKKLNKFHRFSIISR